jgi:hypothetical protein
MYCAFRWGEELVSFFVTKLLWFTMLMFHDVDDLVYGPLPDLSPYINAQECDNAMSLFYILESAILAADSLLWGRLAVSFAITQHSSGC